MKYILILVSTACCFDPHIDPCAIQGACLGGSRDGADASPVQDADPLAPDAVPGVSDAVNATDAARASDSSPLAWDGTYTITVTFVDPETGCDFFPSVVISGVNADGSGQAVWGAVGTGVAVIDVGPDEIRFGAFTTGVPYSEWIGTRDPGGHIFGSLTAPGCLYGLELVKE